MLLSNPHDKALHKVPTKRLLAEVRAREIIADTANWVSISDIANRLKYRVDATEERVKRNLDMDDVVWATLSLGETNRIKIGGRSHCSLSDGGDHHVLELSVQDLNRLQTAVATVDSPSLKRGLASGGRS